MILYGPPGTGKTTLARILATQRRRRVRGALGGRGGPQGGARGDRSAPPSACTARPPTVFFLDEIHRFNKAQQDALLPAVEEGLVALIGATTENPYFEVNSALLSRCRIYELQALSRRRRAGAACAARSTTRARHRRPAERSTTTRSTSWRRAPAATPAPPSARSSSPPRRPSDGDRSRSPPPRTLSSARPCSTTRAATSTTTDLRVDQVDARLRPRRLAALPGRDARGRRGPALHRPPDGHPGERGHRQRRPAGARRWPSAAAHAVEHVGLPEAALNLAQAAVYLALAPKSNASYVAIKRGARSGCRRTAPVDPARPAAVGAAYPGAKALGPR